MSAPALAPDRLAALDAFLVELNAASAAEILPLFRAEHGLENKGGARGFDPVTLADKNAEAAIRALIADRFPAHGVIGEEYGEDRPDAEFVWVIDPVDGTRAFIAGLPVWTTLIGLRHEGRPVLGSIGQPYIGEIFIGHPGAARLIARGGETPLKVRACPGGDCSAPTDRCLLVGEGDTARKACLLDCSATSPRSDPDPASAGHCSGTTGVASCCPPGFICTASGGDDVSARFFSSVRIYFRNRICTSEDD